MIKKSIVSLVSCFLIIAAPLQAKTQEEGLVTNLSKGQTAPYDGVLFDFEATARILADQEYGLLECKLQLEFFQKKQENLYNLEMSKLQISLDSLEEKHKTILNIKDKEIYELQEIVKGKSNSDFTRELWFGSGIVLGVLASLTIFYISVKVVK